MREDLVEQSEQPYDLHQPLLNITIRGPRGRKPICVEVRTWVESPAYIGWSRRNLSLTIEEFDRLIALVPAIRLRLNPTFDSPHQDIQNA